MRDLRLVINVNFLTYKFIDDQNKKNNKTAIPFIAELIEIFDIPGIAKNMIKAITSMATLA